MKREEYMEALKNALAGFDEELVKEIVSDYEERFRIGAEMGKAEEQVIAELGSVEDLLEELSEMQQTAEESFKTKDFKQTAENNTNTWTWEQRVENSTNSGTQNNNENSFKSGGQSGTYYQEKSFADSFDSAMKKFGKVFDKVMREAGRVIEDAAEKIEYHFEEAKKNYANNGKFGFSYYTDSEDFGFTHESSERDGNSEPNVEQFGEGIEGCHRVVIDADFADVTFCSTQAIVPKAVCHYYSHKTAMMYPFYAKQEGDTFYVGVRRNQETETKSGFFQINTSPSIEIELFLPEDIMLVEAGSTSGDFELNEVAPVELVLHTKNGDISAKSLVCDRINMGTVSGDISLLNARAKNTALTTKSGDCCVDCLEGEEGAASLVVRTVSGDADIKNVQAVTAKISTAGGDVDVENVQAATTKINTVSGDIDVKNVQGAMMEASTASGDITAAALKEGNARFQTANGDIGIEDCYGEALEASTASGDINVKAAYKKYNIKSHSGELQLESCQDADIVAHNTSGDVEVHMVEATETYQVSMHSVSGECTTSGQTGSASNVPTKNIEAKTISGDITITFL